MRLLRWLVCLLSDRFSTEFVGCAIVKKSAPVAVSIACGAVINLILNYILIPPLGNWGAAIATVTAWGSGVVYLYIAS